MVEKRFHDVLVIVCGIIVVMLFGFLVFNVVEETASTYYDRMVRDLMPVVNLFGLWNKTGWFEKAGWDEDVAHYMAHKIAVQTGFPSEDRIYRAIQLVCYLKGKCLEPPIEYYRPSTSEKAMAVFVVFCLPFVAAYAVGVVSGTLMRSSKNKHDA